MRRAVASVLIGSLLAGPVWAEQIVLDGKEFVAHVEHDKRVQADLDNLAQQNALYRRNATNYQAVIQRLKDLDVKTVEKDRAQQELITTYEEQRKALVAQQQELAQEVQAVKREKDQLTWMERGKGFAAGVAMAVALTVYVLRGGR